MNIWFGVLIIAAYLLGSVPMSQLVAGWYRLDLRKLGTGQVGAGNLWRLKSWRVGLPVGIFDFGKGLLMVWLAAWAGLDIPQQILVGAAAIIGHNWSVFLRFHGGRGIGTTIGVISVLPLVNDMAPWPTVTFLIIIIAGSLIIRSSPVAALLGSMLLPLVSWASHEPASVTLSLLVIPVIIVIKRMTVPFSSEAASIHKRDVLLNRFIFDRDISDRKLWVYRNHPKHQEH